VHASRYGSNLAQGNSPEWNNMVVTLQQNSPRGKSRDINKQKNEAKRWLYNAFTPVQWMRGRRRISMWISLHLSFSLLRLIPTFR